jgi:predicted TIM-barrel fold metal-dependent hydrolase
MVIDMHVHPEFWEAVYQDEAFNEKRKEIMGRDKLGNADYGFVIRQMDYAGIDKLCLLATDTSTQDGCVVLTNEDLKKIVDLAPDRFFGFASVDPFRKDAVEVVEKAFTELGLQGLNLHPSKQKFYPDDEMMDPIYKLCIKYNKPIMFHAGTSWETNTPAKYAKPLAFEEVAIKYPELRFCLAHMGWPWVQDTAMMILKYPNVYADTSMLYSDRPIDFFHQVFKVDLSPLWLENAFPNKVMFGSNNPRFGSGDMKEGIETLELRPRTEAKVLGGNAVKFLGWED